MRTVLTEAQVSLLERAINIEAFQPDRLIANLTNSLREARTALRDASALLYVQWKHDADGLTDVRTAFLQAWSRALGEDGAP